MWITNKASYSLTISFPYSPTLVLTVFLYLNFEKVAVRWILVYGDDGFFFEKNASHKTSDPYLSGTVLTLLIGSLLW